MLIFVLILLDKYAKEKGQAHLLKRPFFITPTNWFTGFYGVAVVEQPSWNSRRGTAVVEQPSWNSRLTRHLNIKNPFRCNRKGL